MMEEGGRRGGAGGGTARAKDTEPAPAWKVPIVRWIQDVTCVSHGLRRRTTTNCCQVGSGMGVVHGRIGSREYPVATSGQEPNRQTPHKWCAGWWVLTRPQRITMAMSATCIGSHKRKGIRISVWNCMDSRRSCSCLSAPLRPGKQAGRIPEGRRARCAPFPEGTGMCLPEMPRLLAHRSRTAWPTGRPGGLLWLLSWPHKKVTRAKRGTLLALASARDQKPIPH